MKRYILITLLVLAVVLVGAESGGSVFSVTVANLEKYSSLSKVNSTEYKFLVNPVFFAKSRKAGWTKVWEEVKSIARKNGYTITEAKDPYKEELSTKTYMDTADFKIRNMGYVLRKQEKYKSGKPSGSYKYTGKYISTDLNNLIASGFPVAPGVKYSSKIEDNVSLNKDTEFKDYFELARKIKTKENLGNRIADWAKFYPKILTLGLSANTKLIGKTAYSYGIVPGELDFGNGVKVEIEMEAWAHKKDGRPFVAESSYTVKTKDYTKMVETLVKAEGFLKEEGLSASNLVFPDFEKFKGSKVRVLLNLRVK